jgi:hypothetical protein
MAIAIAAHMKPENGPEFASERFAQVDRRRIP